MSLLKPRLRGQMLTLWHFVQARWGLRLRNRAQLDAWQNQQLARFAREILPKAPALAKYADLPFEQWPTMDKQSLLADFAAYNTAGIELNEAMALARQAEQSRDFSPTLRGYSLGLSSGTSGQPGVFLISDSERGRWAGILLARVLPNSLLWQILLPWRPPLRIAFFLRANNNLYQTLNSRRIDFRFYDLLAGWQSALPALVAQKPDALVAPASILRALAEAVDAQQLLLRPRVIISVAEVLDRADQALIERVFAQPVRQIYQATEGFLAYSCEQGGLHLNERHVRIEKEWLEDGKRFMPIITDFSRTTQLIVRYRLHDLLTLAEHACPCGSVDTTLAAIDGRADEILWLAHPSQGWQPLYPEVLRQCLAQASPAASEYRILQYADHWRVELAGEPQADVQLGVEQALTQLCQNQGWQLPRLSWAQWQPEPLGAKRRRILLCQSPKPLACES